jgi:predicted PurR-regulated permease PerM
MTTSRLAALQWLLLIAPCVLLVYLLSPILTPFVAAAILAYICNPLVVRLCTLKLPRSLAVMLVMVALLLLFSGLLLIMLPLLEKEISLLMLRLPDMIELLRVHLLPRLQQWFGADLQWDGAALKNLFMNHWQSAGGLAGKVLPWLSSSGGVILAVLINALLIPVAMFYLLRDGDGMVVKLDTLIPLHWYDKIHEISREVDGVLAEFLRGQISVMLLMSAFYSVMLWMAGLEFALPIGIVAGMLVFIPYLGMVTGLLLATGAAAMQFSSFNNILWVWAVFGSGQMLEGMLVTPWLVGERIGLHPLAVIFALLAFGQLFGFFGILLALPLSAILLVALRHGKTVYLSSRLYQKK